MGHEDVVKSLRGLSTNLSRVLDHSSQQVLQDAIRQVGESHRQFQLWVRRTHHSGAGQRNWGFDIYPHRPLRFIRAEHIRGIEPEVDLYGRMRWTSDNDQPDDACIVLRVWSSNHSYFYREDWDAERFCDILTAPEDGYGISLHRRVLLRLHFDLKTRGVTQREPLYHLHVGGMAECNELCWYPSGIDNPRIPFLPLDLVMACEMVIADLFADKHMQLLRDRSWQALMHQSQKTMLRPYLEEWIRAIDNGGSWLGHLHTAEYRNHGE
jgi:hypothetical protein